MGDDYDRQGWLWGWWYFLGTPENRGCTPLLLFIVMLVVCGVMIVFAR